MTTPKKRVTLAGSERAIHPGARLLGAADPQERIEVTLLLKPIFPRWRRLRWSGPATSSLMRGSA
jgi:hypothetical protein